MKPTSIPGLENRTWCSRQERSARDRIGLHAALAFPGLDGLCEQIMWKWFKYVDEMMGEEKRDFDSSRQMAS